ncbi:MAG: RNA methyltransferase [Candidatus Sericytochromatia bacterium]|nr:RNA methyltransferase [Candidatus Sericytochromatia bacterium]
MLITSRSNTKIKHLRALGQRKARLASGEFVLAGLGLLQEAQAAGYRLHQLFCLPDIADTPAARSLQAAEYYTLPEELMSYAAQQPSAPKALGVLALKQPAEDKNRRRGWLLTESLQDPGNFGALLRLADAMGWRGILTLGDAPDPFQPKVLRGSMGSALRLPVQSLTLDALARWQADGWQLVGTCLDASVSSLRWQAPEKMILALGHEGQGLSPELLALCQQRIRIPMSGAVDSLNVATAAAMLVHEALRQWENP